MSRFERIFKDTMAIEGGYSTDPDDAGGVTYKGISRRFHPSWQGWEIIDGMKDNPDFPDVLDVHQPLQDQIMEFYRSNYWDRFQGDAIPFPELAGEMFDTAVNMGVHRAVLFAQQALNLLNRNQRIYGDIVEDGIFGPATMAALETYTRHDPPEYLLKIMNVLQGNHYIEYMKKSPVQEKYARGWLRRVTLKENFDG